MTAANVVEFLRTVAARPDVLDALKTQGKDEVIDAALQFGYPFTEAEFNALIWDLEMKLAEKRGDPFDPQFGLWQTMWGKYYFEYLVVDLVPSFQEMGLI